MQVQASVQKGIVEMAKHNLEQEQVISEVKNHIAIVRSVHMNIHSLKCSTPPGTHI